MVAHNKLYAFRCKQYLTVDVDSFLTDPQHRAIKTTQQRRVRHLVGARHIGRVGQFGVRANKMAAVRLLSGDELEEGSVASRPNPARRDRVAIGPLKTVTGILTIAYPLAGALSLLPFDFSVAA